MSRIHQAFENKKAFIGFVTGGDPDLETTEKLVVAMEEAGADLGMEIQKIGVIVK